MKKSEYLKIISEGKTKLFDKGSSCKPCLIEYENKKYVLRDYGNGEAKHYFSIWRKLKKYGFLPKIYFIDGQKILLEYIEGRDCKERDTSAVAFQVGRICAIINGLDVEKDGIENKKFSSIIKKMREFGDFSQQSLASLEKLYENLKIKSKPQLAIEFDDIYCENFKLFKGKVYLIDFEDFTLKIKGLGIGKAFTRWFLTEKQNLL